GRERIRGAAPDGPPWSGTVPDRTRTARSTGSPVVDAPAQRDSLGPHAEAWPGPGSSAPRSLGLCQRAACSTATAGRAQDEHFDPALPGPRDDNGRDLRPYRQERPL